MRGKAILGVAAVAGAAIFAATVGASLLDVWDLTTVPAAAPKAAGYAPASQLSTELRQTLVAQGSMPLENPQGIVGWYGYENDAPSPTTPRCHSSFPQRAARRRRRRPSPTRTPTSSSRASTEPIRDYDYGTHFLFQGHEGGATVDGHDAGLHHAHQPRRRRRAPGHADGDQGRRRATRSPTIDGSTWDPFAQRLLLTTENATAPTYAATRRLPVARSSDVSGALGRGGYEGIQNDSDGNIWIVEDIGGSSKPGTTREAAEQLRLPLRPAPARATSHDGKLQVLQVLTQPASRSRSSRRRRSTRPTRSTLHTYGNELRHELGDDPRHGDRRHRAVQRQHARQGSARRRRSSGRRTAQFRPGSKFRRVLLRRDRRHERDEPRERHRTAARRLGVDLEADPAQPLREHRQAVAPLRGRRVGAQRLRQRDVPLART